MYKLILPLQELEQLTKTGAKLAIERFYSEEVLTLNRHYQEIKEAHDEWRNKAKDLQSQVLELTVLQQKLDKRKAHAAALKVLLLLLFFFFFFFFHLIAILNSLPNQTTVGIFFTFTAVCRSR